MVFFALTWALNWFIGKYPTTLVRIELSYCDIVVETQRYKIIITYLLLESKKYKPLIINRLIIY